MIGLIEVASHILCLWQAALLPPFEADVAAAVAAVMAGGRGGVTSWTRTSSFLHYSSPQHNLIFYLRRVKQPLDSVEFRLSLAVFNKLGAENEDITFLCLINLKVESKAIAFTAV